jgi:hypothetical protein
LTCATAALVAAPTGDLAAQVVAPQPFPGPVWVPPPPPPPPPQPPAPWPVFLTWLPMLFVLIAVAIKLKQDREEEEEVNPVETDGPTGYEYKILRSTMGAFKDRATLKATLEEEARAGWELYELLDSCRMRLRRSVAWRAKDAELTQDPYRMRVGASEGAIALRIVLVTLALIGVVVAVLLLVMNK